MRDIAILNYSTKALALSVLSVFSTGAVAQTTIAPLVSADDAEYETDPIAVGPIRISPQILVQSIFDDNVLASPDGSEIEDVEFIVRPELVARVGDQTTRFQLDAYGEFSRFADFTAEDSDTYGVSGLFTLSPNSANRLNIGFGHARLKENRGDPEARDLAGPGPRLFDNTYVDANFRRTAGPVLLSLEATYSDLDAISPIDDDRDFETYAGSATVGYRISGPIYLTATGFVNVRDFRLEATPTDPDRDATTYGGQVGVNFSESERLRGRARVGFFRFDPSDPSLDPRTGFSVNASLVYKMTPRIAFILDAFNGDVATFRRGAQARTDTNVSLTSQVEMRHNLFARVGVTYARNVFVGSGIEEQIFRSQLAVEYLASRRLSLLVEAQGAQRSSDDPTQAYDQVWVSIGARMRF